MHSYSVYRHECIAAAAMVARVDVDDCPRVHMSMRARAAHACMQSPSMVHRHACALHAGARAPRDRTTHSGLHVHMIMSALASMRMLSQNVYVRIRTRTRAYVYV